MPILASLSLIVARCKSSLAIMSMFHLKVNAYASKYFQNKTKIVINLLIMVTFIDTLYIK